jgi:hypothetical protein
MDEEIQEQKVVKHSVTPELEFQLLHQKKILLPDYLGPLKVAHPHHYPLVHFHEGVKSLKS